MFYVILFQIKSRLLDEIIFNFNIFSAINFNIKTDLYFPIIIQQFIFCRQKYIERN